MSILDSLKDTLLSHSDPKAMFGLSNLQFFTSLLLACPEGSRLTFDHSEPESFVQNFREWSHREKPETFEADFYKIDAHFIAAVSDWITRGGLQLDHHFSIVSQDGRPLCVSLDEFTSVSLADDIRERILNLARNT